MALKQLHPGDAFPPGEPDVQRTTFSLDVLGRFICNTWDEATLNPDFDAVVIGSGMYGGYCAAKLFSESGLPGRTPLRVLVLEAGPFLVHEHGQNIPDLGLTNPFRPTIDTFSAEAGKTRHLVWGLGWRGNTGFPGTAYCVGGKSLYWGGWCPRLTHRDLAQWPAGIREYLTSPPFFGTNLPNRLTSAAPADVYEAVEFEIGVKPPDDFVFDPIAGPGEEPGSLGLNAALGARLADALAALRTQGEQRLALAPQPPPIAVQTQSFVSGVFSPDKFSSLTLLMAALRNARSQPDAAARLFLVPNAHVSRIVVPDVDRDGVSSRGFRASGIEVFVDGERRFLPVKPSCAIVLASGCIESTRLALECFPTEPDSPAAERIGRNLMAHLRFDFPFQVDRPAFSAWVQAQTGKRLRDQLQTASFHIQGDTSDGRFHFQVYGTGDNSGNPEGLLYRMIPDREVARRLAGMQSPGMINLVIRACGEMNGDRTAPIHAPQTSWIDLAADIDRDNLFDHRRAFVHYADQGQAAIWRHMRQAAEKLALELGALSLPPEDRHEVGSTWHDSGTLFMGDDPAGSVTDELGHFHHIANIACADQALFPTVGSANPVLTGLGLARRVAETIVDRRTSTRDLMSQEIASERAEGFEFLLEGANAGLWQPNNPRLNEARPHLIAGGSILEVHGDAGAGVLFFDGQQELEDFELRLQWKAFLDAGGDLTANSGIFLRAPRPPLELDGAGFYDRCAEVQIDDTGYDNKRHRFGSPLHRTGAIYGRFPGRCAVQKLPSSDGTEGYWNEFRIIVQGRRLVVWLNGLLASEGDLPPEFVHPGFIGLQYHTGKVQFRQVRVRRL
jgi:choline dehydrogenase-like flavoprotein